MTVAPDLLLKSAPVQKPRHESGNASSRSAQASSNGRSSFADVYAQERQASSKPAQESVSKADRADKSKPDTPSVSTEDSANAGTQSPPIADNGNALPGADATLPATDEPDADDATLYSDDAALLVALDATVTQTQLAANSLKSSGPASMTAASFDPEIDALNQLPAVKLALEIGSKAAAAGEKGAVAEGKMLSTDGGFASAMAAIKQELSGTVDGDGEMADLSVADLSVDQLKALEQGAVDGRPENFASKLNALTQAINPQAAAVKPVLVPGQAVAMQQGGWSEAVVDRVMWLSSQNLKSAEIQLDPAELGRLDVRIHMTADQTQISFASANPHVRDALEGQMHRLREMFNQQGMGLMDASVSDQSSGRGWQGQGSGEGADSARAGADGRIDSDEAALQHAAIEPRQISGSPLRNRVDYYA